jgi:hypothetical protein
MAFRKKIHITCSENPSLGNAEKKVVVLPQHLQIRPAAI